MGESALSLAVYSKSPSAIALLAPLTNAGLDGVVYNIAEQQIELTKPLEMFIIRTANDAKSLVFSLIRASTYGHSSLVNLFIQGQNLPCLYSKLLDGASLVDTDSAKTDAEHFPLFLLDCAVNSDSEETCSAILPHIRELPLPETLATARKRGRRDIIHLLFPDDDYRDTEHAQKINLRQRIIQRKAGIMEMIPKSVEYVYNNPMTKICPLMKSDCQGTVLVPYSVMLKALHLPPTHIEIECPADCKQQSDCDKIRQVYHLIRMIVSTMGKLNPVFKLGGDGENERHPSIVGSLKEGTHFFFSFFFIFPNTPQYGQQRLVQHADK